MQKFKWLFPIIFGLFANCANAATLPAIEGLELNGDQLTWDAQEGASGYNVYLEYRYFDTVRDSLSYTLTEPGQYHVISFNDAGEYGSSRNVADSQVMSVEFTGSSINVNYDFQWSTLLVYNTCKDVGPGETCIARCPSQYEHQFGTANIQYLSGGACSTSDIVEADAFVSPLTYRCTVPTFSGEVVAQAICVTY